MSRPPAPKAFQSTRTEGGAAIRGPAWTAGASRWNTSRTSNVRHTQQRSIHQSSRHGHILLRSRLAKHRYVVQDGRTASTSDTGAMKSELLQLLTRLNSLRGPVPGEDRAAFEQLVGQLTDLSPVSRPAESALINGRWVLLYTFSPGQGLRPDRQLVTNPLQRASAQLYAFFYKYVPILAGTAVGRRAEAKPVTGRGNFQTFDTANGTIDNQARFTLLGREGEISVPGTCWRPEDDPTAGRRLLATFTSFTLTWDKRPRLSFSLKWLKPTGFIDTLFLDEELRISRGDKGSIFVARRAEE